MYDLLKHLIMEEVVVVYYYINDGGWPVPYVVHVDGIDVRLSKESYHGEEYNYLIINDGYQMHRYLLDNNFFQRYAIPTLDGLDAARCGRDWLYALNRNRETILDIYKE